MDFCNSGKKKKSGAGSRDASRAGTPEGGEGAGNSNEESGGGKVTYALDNVVAESKGWVLDKGAGETILVRYTMIQNIDLMNMCVYIKKSL